MDSICEDNKRHAGGVPFLSTVISLILSIGGNLAAAAAASSVNLERAQKLVNRYVQLETELEATLKAAQNADPKLREYRTAYEEMKDWYDNGLAQEKRRYIQWKNSHSDPQQVDRVFDRLQGMTQTISFAEDLDDPEMVPYIKHALLPMLIEHAKDPGTIVGPYVKPGETNFDAVWEGFKRYRKEAATHMARQMSEYVDAHGLPDWFVQLASDMARGETYLMFYKKSMQNSTGYQETEDIKREMLAVCRELGSFFPQWNELRGLANQINTEALKEIEATILNDPAFTRPTEVPGDVEINTDRIDDYTLALLYLVTWDRQNGYGAKARTNFDWDTMDRLHKKGFISDVASRPGSVLLSEKGYRKAEKMFSTLFRGKE